MRHMIRNYRDPQDGKVYAVCSCGKSTVIHAHIEQETLFFADYHLEPLPQHEPPLKKQGFVSGLPDWH